MAAPIRCEPRLQEGWNLSRLAERAAARFAALVAYDGAWRQAVSRHAEYFALVEYEGLQAQGREAAIGAMLATWRVPACRSFNESTARLVNSSTTECYNVVKQVFIQPRSQCLATAHGGRGAAGGDAT